jgi:Astacin (Peptidase family M12A)
MNLGWTGDLEANRGVILHEFGHTLGLLHEHQSPVRGKKITLKEKRKPRGI